MSECPRCHNQTLRDVEVENALSRRDNNTYICSGCGNEEAMIDANLEKLLSESLVVLYSRENAFRRSMNIGVYI